MNKWLTLVIPFDRMGPYAASCFLSSPSQNNLLLYSLFRKRDGKSFYCNYRKCAFSVSRKTRLVACVDVSRLWTQLEQGTVVFDFEQFSYFRISGNDRLSFVHNMSSNHFLDLHPVQTQWTCFLTSTGRLLDVALVILLQDSLLVVSSIEKKQTLWEHFDRHIFPMDNVEVKEENYASFVLLGKYSNIWMQDWYHKLGTTWKQETIQVFENTTNPIYLIHQSTLEPEWNGYLLLCSPQDIHIVHSSMESFLAKGFLLSHMYKEHWECLRITIGKGNVLREWSEKYHPLEAGLWHMVSFHKGCYLGQETILRLRTYDGVKRYLVGWYLEYPVEPFSYVYCQETRVGIITSCIVVDINNDRIVIGLGYLQRDYATLKYMLDESLQGLLFSQHHYLNWDSTSFVSKGQGNALIRCIPRTISFPVWHSD